MKDQKTQRNNQSIRDALQAIHAQNNENTQKELMHSIMNGIYLVPILLNRNAQRRKDGTAILKEEDQISFPTLSNPKKGSYLMAFSDWPELYKWKKDTSQQAIVFRFADYVNVILHGAGKVNGFVIDPCSLNLSIDKKQLEMLEQLLKGKNFSDPGKN